MSTAAVAREFGASGVGRGFGLLMTFVPAIGLAPFALAKIQELTTSYTPGLLGRCEDWRQRGAS